MANTKGTYEITISDDNIYEPINEDILSNLNQFDAGYLFGAGVQGRYNRSIDLFLDFRYTRGFIDLDNNTADTRYNFNYDSFWPEKAVDKPRNKAIMFTVGIIVYLVPR